MKSNLGISYEYFATSIFGNRYHGSASYFEEKTYKKFLRELSNQIQKAVAANIIFTDAHHEKMVNMSLKEIGDAMAKKEYQAHLIKGLVKLLFWIMGTYPSNWHIQSIRGRKSLTNFQHARTLNYSQDLSQKMGAIFEAHGYYGDFSKKISVDDLRSEFHKAHSKWANHSTFIKWYKKNYPDLYLKLF